jgi:branched-chain amino acid transport system ATP-binding protein
MTMLSLESIYAGYGKSQILHSLSLSVGNGESVALLGRNGVGKTTTLRTIMGLTPISKGAISLDGERLDKLSAYNIPRRGIGYVPQGRRIFPKLTVYENLCIGLPNNPKDGELDWIFQRFPRLKERRKQAGGTLSGGEQQMLAIARCLVLKPRVLILDEPTEGIMPKLVADIREEIKSINRSGVSILLVEQNVLTAVSVCSRIYIMEKGRICVEQKSEELRSNAELVHRYLGVSL